MALKRREGRSYSVEEMMNSLNKEFIKGNRDSDSDTTIYVISSTCFQDSSKRFLVCDSRDNESREEAESEWLSPHYGSTILEAVTKAFANRNSNG